MSAPIERDEAWIYHLTPRAVWDALPIDERYTADSLKSEGFIHCSYNDQITGTANLRFAGRDDLILLTIAVERLDVPLVVEATVSVEPFPHVYGSIPREAVVEARDIAPDAEGHFRLP